MTLVQHRAPRSLFVLLLLAAGLLAGSLLSMAGPAPLATSARSPRLDAGPAAAVARWEARVAAQPGSAEAHALLGLAYLQQVRETADPTLYTRAERAFDAALQRSPQQQEALIGRGLLALARHDFAGAIIWAGQVRALNPYRAQPLGILTDAYVELGRYDEALTTVQEMLTLRPDLAAYSRLAYLHELHGDMPGAVAAMETAVRMAVPTSEAAAWARSELGHLHLEQGQLDAAEATFEAVLADRPGYAHALAGLAEVAAARGQTATAITGLETVLAQTPLAEFAITLGELHAAAGQQDAAARRFAQARQLLLQEAAAGTDVDLELARLLADYGNADEAVALARSAYARRPSVHAADALAWALYRSGADDEAWPFSQEALRLGTPDPHFHDHAARIAQARGEDAAADYHRAQARVINPTFTPPPPDGGLLDAAD